ncbi:hypothetical protein [Bermanella sp. R86510]|uniref:hypothetical protein n=1 Tax=unclassified Bermanella TaxID=2627862 RepID=UPI0037C6FB44
MQTKRLLPSLIVTLMMVAFVNSAFALEFVGKAYHHNNNKLLYEERHELQLDEQGRYQTGTVTYTLANGEPLAIKNLSYGETTTAPSFEFDDKRLDERHSVDVGSKQLVIKKDGEQEKVDLPSKLTPVVDAGFNVFMQQHLDDLLKGKSKTFEFLAIGRASFYEFEVSVVEKTQSEAVIELRPAGWFLSKLVDSIMLTYDVNNKRLLRYEGLGNIEKVENGRAQDENYIVRIEYEYQ